jgi:glycosyltransferase involved in cell wall biosynthesis
MKEVSRILQVCPRYFPSVGGLEEHVRNISERLALHYGITVATTDPTSTLPREERINGVRILRFHSWAPNEAYYFSGKLKKYLSENSHKYTILHAHSYHAFPALYTAQTKKDNKMIFTPHYHGSGHTWFRRLLLKPYKLLGKKIYDKADEIITVSKFEKTLILKDFDVSEEKIVTIPNGIDPEEFKDVIKTHKDHWTILSVGRLEEYKGMQHLIRVLPALDNDVTLEIVGKGPYKTQLVNLAKKQGMTARVRFYQDLSRKELLQKYADADVFVLLSNHEAFSIVIAEALASKTPCIVAGTSALTEWVDNKNCFGIDYPVDPQHLAELLSNVIGKQANPTRLPTWNETAEKTRELYRTCLI